MTISSQYRAIGALILAVTMLPATAHAQLKGHYVPGFTGLQNGSQGPASITIVLPLFFYTTDTLKDDEGNTLGQHPRINSSFLGPGVLWVTNVKVLGGNLGGQVIPLDFMKARIEGPSLTGRLVGPIAHRSYVQWPEMEQLVPRAQYAGNVFARP